MLGIVATEPCPFVLQLCCCRWCGTGCAPVDAVTLKRCGGAPSVILAASSVSAYNVYGLLMAVPTEVDEG